MFGPQPFVFRNSHTIFGRWVLVYHHMDTIWTMWHIHSWPLYNFDLLSQYQNYSWPWICVLARSSLLSDIGIRNLAHCCITIRHHVVHDLCLTVILGCGGFTHNFYLVSIDELSVAMAVAKVSLVNGTNFPLKSSSQELFGQSLPNWYVASAG